MTRLILDMGTRRAYAEVYSIKKYLKIIALTPLQTGVW